MINDIEMIAIACKSNLYYVGDVNDHLNRLSTLKNLLPEYRSMRVIGVFDVLEHIDEDDVVLQQMFQATNPGG